MCLKEKCTVPSSRFLPALAKDTFDKVLDKNNILRPTAASLEADQDIRCTLAATTLTIGKTIARRHAPETRGKVPETLFYDTVQKIPLIVVDPRAAADATRGTVEQRFVEAVDIVPTLLDALGIGFMTDPELFFPDLSPGACTQGHWVGLMGGF